jgi:DNA-binding PucR family transcriptional regulator
VGVGEVCTRVQDFPGSYRQAQLALRIQVGTGTEPRATVFEDLGVYRLFGDLADLGALEEFATKWLGPLLDYDARKNSELVFTLDRYLAAGGSYDASARAVGTHRSTLKYRLQRIRDISRLDLGDPDTLFNLQLATRAWSTLRALRNV